MQKKRLRMKEEEENVPSGPWKERGNGKKGEKRGRKWEDGGKKGEESGETRQEESGRNVGRKTTDEESCNKDRTGSARLK